MKKRLLSLLFAVITIFNMMPWGVMASETETETNDPVPLDISELEMGKLYSATFDYEYDTFIPYKQSEEDPDLLEWKGFPDVLEDDAYVSKADFPQQLIVQRLSEDDEYYVYVTNEDWPDEYNEYRIIDIAEIIITGEYVDPNPPSEELVYGEVGLTVGGKTVETLDIAKGDKVYVSADLSDAITGTPTYVWQLLIDSANDVWAVIQDYAYPYAVVSEALIANAGIDGGNVTLRCIAKWNGASYVSSELGISVSESYPDEAPVSDFAASVEPVSYNSAESSGASQVSLLSTRAVSEEPATVSLMSTRSVTEEYPKVAKLAARVVTEAFQIQIDYIFKHASSSNNGDKAAQAVTVTIPEGAEEYSGTIPSTPVVGYLPVVSAENSGYIKLPDGKVLEDLKTTYNGEIYYIADTLALIDINEKKSITVYYIPQEVNFRVFIYEQQLYTDGYDLAGTVTKTGISDTAVGEGLSESRTGFTPLYYDPETVISGDGTTVVKLYYDRNYYLVKFDLNDTDKGTAYGATPFYVRYNTQVMLPTPTLPGYTFNNWGLERVYTKSGDTETVINDESIKSLYNSNTTGGSSISVKHNVDYTANWSVSTTSYTIVYWLENADSTDSYDIWKTELKTDKSSGDYVAITELSTFESNAPFETLTISGNGRTINLNEKNYFTYESAKTTAGFLDNTNYNSTENGVVVKGDGSTIINVYYSRKSYTIKFYYTRRDSGGSYWVTTGTEGSSNNGGTFASAAWSDTNLTSEPYLSNTTLTAKTETSEGYTYYYLEIEAKYGASLQDVWPSMVIGSLGSQNFVSWGTQYGCPYNLTQSNRNIKGIYQKMDASIIVDPNNSTAQFMVGYWNSEAPQIRYDVYYEALGTEGTDVTIYTEPTTQRKFVFQMSDTLRANDETLYGQSQLVFDGMQEIANTRSGTPQKDATDRHVNYYFERINYTIEYDSGYSEPISETVPYGATLNTDDLKKENFGTTNYPSAFEAGEYEFAGWYIDEACQIAFDFNTTMPAKNILLYAKWNKLSYTGKVYLDSSKTELLSEQTVLFGTGITAPDYTINGKYTSTYKEMIFSGWYYMDGSEEKRFDFNTMVIKQDLDIYAKWTSHVPVQYTVYYVVLKDDHSVNIADPMEGECLAGESKTFAALTGADLYEGYREGYFPKSRSTSKVMSSTEVNEIIFEYYIPTHLEYTVEHEFVNDDFIDIIGVNTIKLSKTITIDGDSVKTQSANLTISFEYGITVDTIAEATGKSLDDTEKTKLYNIVTQMSPDYIQQDIILVPEDKNIIKFNWEDRGSVSTYQVVYYSQTLDANGIQNGYKVDYTLTFVGDIAADGAQPGDPGHVEAETPDKTGFKINETLSKTSGYIEKATIGDSSSGLILSIYYDRLEYSYTVHHYKRGTTVELADNEGGTAYFGAFISIEDVSKTITGYDLYNDTDSVEIASDNQEIICYYIGKDVIYRYLIAGDTSGGYLSEYTPDPVTVGGERPVATELRLFNGYYLNRWYYQISGSDEKIAVPDSWISEGQMTLQPTVPTEDLANKTVYVYAEVLPTVLTIAISEMVEQGAVFDIKKADNSFSMRVVVFEPNMPVSVYGLTNGATYTVTMDPDWAWQYGVSVDTCEVTITEQNNNASFKLIPPGDGTTSGNIIVTDGAHNNQ